MCVVTETLTISPFSSGSDSYQFQGLCDHYLLRLCDTTNELSVTADFTSTSIASARVGLRYRQSSIVSTETGQILLSNLSLLAITGQEELYNNGLVVSRESGLNHITLQLVGNISVIHTYRGSHRSIQVLLTEDVSFGGTDVPIPLSVCGLCGSENGALLGADLLTTADINNMGQIESFIEGYTVVASEQFLRGQRRECSEFSNQENHKISLQAGNYSELQSFNINL